jgi:hypothetical protein
MWWGLEAASSGMELRPGILETDVVYEAVAIAAATAAGTGSYLTMQIRCSDSWYLAGVRWLGEK